MINENLTNEEESDFNDKYTRILVKYPKENNIKTSNSMNSNAGIDHSSPSETKHGNYAIEYCITSLGEYFYCYCITSFWSITMLCSEITGLWLMKWPCIQKFYIVFSCLISCYFIFSPNECPSLSNVGFHIMKIWQIIKHITGSFQQA